MTERQKSDRREKQFAKEEGGRRVVASGSTPIKKEDISFRGVLLQDKRGSGASISIKASDLKKLEFHSMNAGKVGVLSFSFDGLDLEYYCFPTWFVRGKDWWQELKGGE